MLSQAQRSRQPWIHSAAFDLVFILAPALLVTLFVLARPDWFSGPVAVSPLAWLLLVLCVDVSHVYSTLYKTYFDPAEFRERRTLYTLVPLFVWLAGVVLYSFGALAFWRTLAYLAVFHFVRQQYGFMRLYSVEDNRGARLLNAAAIYAATLYPLVYWHTNLPRQFQWFVEGDFVSLPWSWLESAAFIAYVAVLSLYLLKEVWVGWRRRSVNLPRNLLLIGTALSWYVGIVTFNGDLAFTATNVIAHGLPYLALIWITGRKRESSLIFGVRRGWVFGAMAAPLFVGFLVVLAFVEEGFWDALVWRDHTSIFGLFSFLPQLTDAALLAFVVPLLAVPQATHYVLDGFIWRRGRVVAASETAAPVRAAS